MIKLTKLQKPDVLETNETDWTNELLSAVAAGGNIKESIKARYRHPQIKLTLEKETHHKCAYCESKIKHISHGDIEHIFPKSKDLSKSFEWENLTLACEICNQNKGIVEIIDPYIVDPESHLHFAGPMAMANPDSHLGLLSLLTLRLNRSELFSRRIEKLEAISRELRIISSCSDEILKNALISNLKEQFLFPSSEYSLMAKHYTTPRPEIGTTT